MKGWPLKYFTTTITRDQAKDSGMALVLILLFLGFIVKELLLFKIALAALLIDMIFPMFYYPFAIFWYGISGMLGSIFSRVFLWIIYFIMVLPVALIRRFMGKDPLSLKRFKENRQSVMSSRNHTYTASDLEKPF
jgi:hypothetical protein